jgi:uncharacterized membrane protein
VITFSCAASLRETGIVLFYTSVVLIFGFAIFHLIKFVGTIALGGLISEYTLLFYDVYQFVGVTPLVLTFERRTKKEDAEEIGSAD